MEGREANKRLKNYHEASEDELEEEEEEDEGDDDRGMSTDESTESSAHSSRCGSPTYRSNGDTKKKKKKLKNKNVNPKLNYKCIGYWKENHGHPIFGVSVNHHLDSSSPTVFATVGYNRVTIYEAMSGGIKLLQVSFNLKLCLCPFYLCSYFFHFSFLCVFVVLCYHIFAVLR